MNIPFITLFNISPESDFTNVKSEILRIMSRSPGQVPDKNNFAKEKFPGVLFFYKISGTVCKIFFPCYISSHLRKPFSNI
jgi:hypothetical protein